MPVLLRRFGWQIAEPAVGKLHQEGLPGGAPGADLIAVIEEQFKRVGGKGKIVEPHHVNFGIYRVIKFLHFIPLQGPRIDVERGGIVVVQLFSALEKVPHLLLRFVAFPVGHTAQGQFQVFHGMAVDRFGLNFLDFFHCHFNFVEHPFADLPSSFDIEHGRVGVTEFRVVADDVRILDRRFGFHPADQVARTLVPRGGAERKQKQIFPVFLTQQNFDFSPIVRGNNASLLHDLSRAGDIGDHAGQVLFVVVNEHQFHAVVVPAFQFGEGGGIGVAPHLGGPVRIADAAVHSHCRSAKAGGIAARFAVVPCLNDCFGDGVRKIIESIVRAHAIVRRHLREIFTIRSHIMLDPFPRTAG